MCLTVRSGPNIDIISFYHLLTIPAIIVAIASARYSCTLPALAPKAARAVSRWQDLWKAAMSKVDEEELHPSGLVKHTNEMHWLAKRLIEVSVGGKEDAAYFRGIAHESVEEFHALIKELQGK